jgi:hypothetical protein
MDQGAACKPAAAGVARAITVPALAPRAPPDQYYHCFACRQRKKARGLAGGHEPAPPAWAITAPAPAQFRNKHCGHTETARFDNRAVALLR